MSDYITICEKASRAGGEAIQKWLGRVDVQEKGPADLVTQADFSSQKIIRQIIAEAFPDHDFLGEEDSPSETHSESAEYRWIADPLDGTTNFVHGVPHYAVSLALERRGTLLVGTVYDPNTDECFTASADGGAFLNGRPIRTSRVGELANALAAVGFPPGVDRHAPDVLVFLEAIERCQAIRRTGSAALNLCYLAAGRFDVFWSFSTKIWDVAAGALILQEAGGSITATDGGPFVFEDGTFLAASNKKLHEELQALVRQRGNGDRSSPRA